MKLIQVFAETANRNLSKIALISEKNQLTYEDMLYLIEALDRQLLGRGVGEGASIAVRSRRPEIDFAMAFLQSYRGFHVIFAPVEQLVGSGVELDFALVTEDTGLIASEKTILISDGWFEGMGSGKLPVFDKPTAMMGSVTHTSSGSTGRPKFIRADEGPNTTSVLRRDRQDRQRSGKTRLLSTLAHTMRWSMNAYLNVLILGGSVVALGDDQDRLIQYIDLYRVNMLLTTPVIMRRMVEFEGARGFLASLEFVQAGGAFTSNLLLEQFTGIFDGKVSVGYGTTEISGICRAIYDRNSKFDDNYIGRIHRKDVEIAFFDEEMNHLPDANEGIVGFRNLHPETLPYYIGNNADDAKSGFINGYFFPGDIMRREGDELYISGRLKNIINVGGNKVSLELVQSVLDQAMPYCQWVPLAMEDKFGIDQLVLFYTSKVEPTLAEVNAILAGRNLLVSASDLVAVAQFMLTDSGKIDVQSLRAGYDQG